jgi:hypothetical protein
MLAKSSYPLRRLHRASEAKQRLDAALVILRNTKDYPATRIVLSSPACTVLRAIGDYQAEAGDPRQALTAYEQLLEKVMVSKPDALSDLRDTPKLSSIYAALASLYLRVGEASKAEGMQAKRTELWRHWQQALPQNSYVRNQLEAANRMLTAR